MIPKRAKKKGKYFAIKTEYDGKDKKICKYIADFKYKDYHGDWVIEDTKGIITQVFSLKKKLVEALYPGVNINIVKDPRA